MKSLHTMALVAIFGASACSLTVPVKGQMTDGSETFTGTATGEADSAGTLTIVSNRGRTCTGDFVYTTGRTGEGIFQCDDGQSGPFRFVSTGLRGSGTGTIGGQNFTFTFGR